jgi:hypothetical protein
MMANRRWRRVLRWPPRQLSRWAAGSTRSPFAVLLALLWVSTSAFSVGETIGLGQPSALNNPPRLSALKARIGRVHLEGGGTKEGGIRGTFRLCDDGPQTSRGRHGLISITHRSGTSLLVRERYPSTSWDIYFAKPECRSGIFWSSTIPADLPSIRTSPCYSVAIRVRDPGGLWSNVVALAVNRCPRRQVRSAAVRFSKLHT